jgi:hypothetical protein
MPVTYVPITVPDAATYTVKSQNAGLIHYMPDLTADCTITPPAPKAGLWFEFVYSGTAADAQDWIIDTGTNTNYFVGGVLYALTSAGDTEDEIVAVDSDNNSNSKITVLTPEAGTRVRIESTNGTTWHVSGVVVSADPPTFTDQ